MLIPTFSKGTPEIDDGVYENMKKLWEEECKKEKGNYRAMVMKAGKKDN